MSIVSLAKVVINSSMPFVPQFGSKDHMMCVIVYLEPSLRWCAFTTYMTSSIQEEIMLKWVWPSINRYRMCFVQTSTPPPHMHQKLTKHKRFCKQNNQLPTKSHDELKDNSITMKFLKLWRPFFPSTFTMKGLWETWAVGTWSVWGRWRASNAILGRPDGERRLAGCPAGPSVGPTWRGGPHIGL